MKLIIPSVELCHPGYSLDDIKRHIVKCAQVCYKIDKDVDDPNEWIKTRLLDKPIGEPRHTSPLAHGTVYLTVNAIDERSSLYKNDWESNYIKDVIYFYEHNPYSRVIKRCKDQVHITYYITTNYRVLYEKNRMNDLRFLTKPLKNHIKRYTFKVNCDIGVSREANRHTTLSVSEQSTRYCNYTNERFDGGVQIEVPTDFLKEDTLLYNRSFKNSVEDILYSRDEQWDAFQYWWFANQAAEYAYNNLIRLGWKPQQARRILPLDTHTEVYYTAFETDWKHFLNLRDHKNAHPDMRLIARMIKEQLEKEQNKYK